MYKYSIFESNKNILITHKKILILMIMMMINMKMNWLLWLFHTTVGPVLSVPTVTNVTVDAKALPPMMLVLTRTLTWSKKSIPYHHPVSLEIGGGREILVCDGIQMKEVAGRCCCWHHCLYGLTLPHSQHNEHQNICWGVSSKFLKLKSECGRFLFP